MKIEEALAQLRAAADHLRDLDPTLADDEAAWVGTLDGLTDGLDLAEWLAERALHLEGMAEIAADRAKALQARAKRFEANGDRLRGIILALIEAAGTKKLVRPAMTLSARDLAPRVVATDASLTPPQYLTTITTTAPDKKAITEALDLGAAVDGWMKTNGGRSLTIRTK